jgi:superfamily II DNA or RNA helicase
MQVIIDGYAWCDFSDWRRHKVDSLCNQLVVSPVKTSSYQGIDDLRPIKSYVERDGLIGVPRAFYFNNKHLFGPVEENIAVSNGSEIGCKFVGEYRDDQEAAVNHFVTLFNSFPYSGGILQAPGAWGKSIFAVQLISAIGRTALIMVHRGFLMDQWKERINQFMPDAKVGIIRQKKCQYEGYDIALMMVQSGAAREYPESLLNWPGCIFVDEVHRFGAKSWHSVGPRFKSKFRLGLSATPRRKDGCVNLFKWHIGEISYKTDTARMTPLVKRIFTTWCPYLRNYPSPSSMPLHLLLRFMVTNEARNRVIIDELVKAARSGRKILVFSERKKHLEILNNMFLDAIDVDIKTGFFAPGISKKKKKEVYEADVIFTTYQMASEGFDLDSADTEFLATPISDIAQPSFRITRFKEDKKQPLIVDFIDEKVRLYNRKYQSRLKYYKKVDAVRS